jgi:hypothetical protein
MTTDETTAAGTPARRSKWGHRTEVAFLLLLIFCILFVTVYSMGFHYAAVFNLPTFMKGMVYLDRWIPGEPFTESQRLIRACTKGGPDSIHAMLEMGIDPNLPGPRLQPLHWAVLRCHPPAEEAWISVAKHMIECGADFRARNHEGMTPADYAEYLEKERIHHWFIANGYVGEATGE